MKRARGAREAFDVRKEVFAVGKMCGEERNLLRKRFRAELVAVRGLLEKADQLLAPGAVEGCRGLAALPGKEEGRPLLGGEPPSHGLMKADDGKATESRKTSPLAEHKEAPMMTTADRQQLAFSLVALAAELSDHPVELLPKQSHGGRREIEVNVNAMEDAALFELKMHVDKFVKTRDPSLPPQDDGKIVEDEDENDKRVDICPGVSPAAIVPSPLTLEILEYAAVFNATGLVDKMLSPLPQNYLALAEKGEKGEREYVVEKEQDEEYVDICGDASPVVIQNLAGAISRNPSISSGRDSDSGSDSHIGSHSDTNDSVSGSGNHSDNDKKAGTPAPPVLPKVSNPAPAVLSKVIDNSAPVPPSDPTLELVQNGELNKLDSPAPAILRKVNGDSAGRPSEPAPVVQNAEPENVSSLAPSALCKMVDGSAAQPSEPALEVVPSQNEEPADKHNSPAPAVLAKVNGHSAGQTPVVQNAEPEKVGSPSPAVLHSVVDYYAPSLEAGLEVVQKGFETEKLARPAPSVRLLSKVRDGSSLLSSKPAPEVVHNAELEQLPDKPATAPPARSMSELIAAALEKRRREERSQAREKARQELVEMERSAMTSHWVHPVDMEQLGIVNVEHMVTQQRRPGVPPSLLQQLGLFLKAEDDGGEQQQQQQQQQPSSDPGVEDLEEGEIPL